MDKVLKISIISLVLTFGFALGFKTNAADCGICKFGSGACTIDLRPGEGDGTLCNCSNGGACTKGEDDTCGCKKLETAINTEDAAKGDIIPATNNEVDNNAVTTTSNTNQVTKTNSSIDLNSSSIDTTSYVLIGIGALVLIGGIFGIVKLIGSKKK